MSFSLISSYGSGGLASNNPLVSSFQFSASANLLVVHIMTEGDTARTGGAPTYNGTPLTDSGEGFVAYSGGECGVELWYLSNPDQGDVYNLSVPNSGSLNIGILMHWLYVDAGDVSFVESGSATGITANPTMATSSQPTGRLICCGLASGYRNTASIVGDWLMGFAYHDAGAFVFGLESRLSTWEGVNNPYWTQVADDWGLIYFILEEAAGGAMPILVADRRRRT